MHLFSSTYRGKISGLKIGGDQCDITSGTFGDIKTTDLKVTNAFNTSTLTANQLVSQTLSSSAILSTSIVTSSIDANIVNSNIGNISDMRVNSLTSATNDIEVKDNLIITDPYYIKLSTIGSNTSSGVAIQDEKKNNMVTINPSSGFVDFKYSGRFNNDIYTNIIQPKIPTDELAINHVCINKLNTYYLAAYRNLNGFQVNGTTFETGTEFPASLTSSTFIKTNFIDLFDFSLYGWSAVQLFSQDSVYQVSFNITADNTNHDVYIELSSHTKIAPHSNTSQLARCIIVNGSKKSAGFSGLWHYTTSQPVIALTFYSPQGSTTLNNMNFNIGLLRLN
jgi:hypothetical protein